MKILNVEKSINAILEINLTEYTCECFIMKTRDLFHTRILGFLALQLSIEIIFINRKYLFSVHLFLLYMLLGSQEYFLFFSLYPKTVCEKQPTYIYDSQDSSGCCALYYHNASWVIGHKDAVIDGSCIGDTFTETTSSAIDPSDPSVIFNDLSVAVCYGK